MIAVAGSLLREELIERRHRLEAARAAGPRTDDLTIMAISREI